MQDTADVTRRLWALCGVLRNDGITYHEYLNELTYLLFLKLAKELDMEKAIPRELGWKKLSSTPQAKQLEFYRESLRLLSKTHNEIVREIFREPRPQLTHPPHSINWSKQSMISTGTELVKMELETSTKA